MQWDLDLGGEMFCAGVCKNLVHLSSQILGALGRSRATVGGSVQVPTQSGEARGAVSGHAGLNPLTVNISQHTVNIHSTYSQHKLLSICFRYVLLINPACGRLKSYTFIIIYSSGFSWSLSRAAVGFTRETQAKVMKNRLC